MYTPGNIIYFTPFYFQDGNPCKNKYLLVLQDVEGHQILGGLATRSDHIPEGVYRSHGCISKSEINFNCYFFEQGRHITNNNWGFPENTHIYGCWLTFFSLKMFNDLYKTDGVDYRVIGTLTKKEYNAVINCMKNSPSVKRKIRRALGAEI